MAASAHPFSESHADKASKPDVVVSNVRTEVVPLRGATSTITGHSLRDVRSVLDSNYLHRDPALGLAATHKLESGTKFPN